MDIPYRLYFEPLIQPETFNSQKRDETCLKNVSHVTARVSVHIVSVHVYWHSRELYAIISEEWCCQQAGNFSRTKKSIAEYANLSWYKSVKMNRFLSQNQPFENFGVLTSKPDTLASIPVNRNRFHVCHVRALWCVRKGDWCVRLGYRHSVFALFWFSQFVFICPMNLVMCQSFVRFGSSQILALIFRNLKVFYWKCTWFETTFLWLVSMHKRLL